MKRNAVVRRSSQINRKPTCRPGLSERQLLASGDSRTQNVVLVNAEPGSEVELHEVSTDESIYFLSGTFELVLPEGNESVGAGDLVYFESGSRHGLRCTKGKGRFLVFFAPPTSVLIDDEWLRTIYAQAWSQYTHEDDLSQRRNNLYITIQAALMALLTGMSRSLLALAPADIGSYSFRLGWVILGSMFLTFSVFAILLGNYWRAVTKAGRGYLTVRWMIAHAVERTASVDGRGIAHLEDEWKRHSREKGTPFTPFEQEGDLRRYEIEPAQQIRGWDSLLRVITVVQILWCLLFLAGAALLVTALWPIIRSNLPG